MIVKKLFCVYIHTYITSSIYNAKFIRPSVKLCIFICILCSFTVSVGDENRIRNVQKMTLEYSCIFKCVIGLLSFSSTAVKLLTVR